MKITVTVDYEINLRTQTFDDVAGYLEYVAKEQIENMKHEMMPWQLLNSKIKIEEV